MKFTYYKYSSKDDYYKYPNENYYYCYLETHGGLDSCDPRIISRYYCINLKKWVEYNGLFDISMGSRVEEIPEEEMNTEIMLLELSK
jgi:hypothetical protein